MLYWGYIGIMEKKMETTIWCLGFFQLGCRVGLTACLEGQGDLVSVFIMGITRVTIRVMGVIRLLIQSR